MNKNTGIKKYIAIEQKISYTIIREDIYIENDENIRRK